MIIYLQPQSSLPPINNVHKSPVPQATSRIKYDVKYAPPQEHKLNLLSQSRNSRISRSNMEAESRQQLQQQNHHHQQQQQQQQQQSTSRHENVKQTSRSIKLKEITIQPYDPV